MDQSLLPNIYDFIDHTPPFSQLSPLEKDALAASIKIFYFSTDDELKDEDLCSCGLYMIRSGAVEQINKDGTLRSRLGVGDSFGYTQLNKQGVSDYTVKFLENSLLYLVNKQILDFIKSKNKYVSEYFATAEWVRLSSTHIYKTSKLNKIFTQKIKDVRLDSIAIANLDTTIEECAIEIGKKDAQICVVVDENEKAIGIVTKSDLALRVVAKALDVKNKVSTIMTSNVVTINENDTLYTAFETMVSYNIKSVPIISASEKILGAIDTKQLLQNSQLQSIYLIKKINKTKDIDKLIELSKHKIEIFRTLVDSNADPSSVELVMSKLSDAFYKQIFKIALEKYGTPPCQFALIVAGSLARNEVHFMSDQDNAIILERELDEKERQYFKDVTTFACQTLDKCGYTLCEGNYMACNDKWCVSYNTWEEYFNKWTASTNPKDILDIIVFLDMRYMLGDEFLVAKLKKHMVQKASENSRFIATMGASTLSVSPPLGMFRQFVLTKDGENRPYFDIKKQAINLVVELARVYALTCKSIATDTISRLHEANAHGKLGDNDLIELTEAYKYIDGVRFSHQLKALEKGEEISNKIAPELLSQFEKNHLKDAFRIIAKQQEAASFIFIGK